MHPHRKLGRKPRGHANLPHLSQMRMAKPTIPAAKSWLDGMPDDLGMMLNDRLGCCSCAALGHARQVWSFNAAGQMVTDPDGDIMLDYEDFCGYDPEDPTTDNGGVLQDVLAKAMHIGIRTASGPDRPLGYVEIDPRVQSDIREVVALGGVAYLGIDIPEAWTEMNAGGVWDVTDSPIGGGHCIIAAGYDAAGFDIISWGMRFRITNAAFARYCDEAYWIADRSWIEKTGMTPGGITLAQMQSAMASVKEAA